MSEKRVLGKGLNQLFIENNKDTIRGLSFKEYNKEEKIKKERKYKIIIR